jgi:ABC-type sugar transport system permease subunit
VKAGPQKRQEPWAAAASLGFVAVLASATCASVFWMSWEADRAEIEEHRSLFFANALGHVASTQGDYEAQRFVSALPSAGGKGELPVVEAFVIADGGVDEFGISRGQSYTANLQAELRHKILSSLKEPRHRTRSDRFSRATAGFGAPAEEGRAHPAFVLERDTAEAGPAVRAAQVPVLRTDVKTPTVAGSAGVSLRETIPPPPLPLGMIFGVILGIWLLASIALFVVSGARRAIWSTAAVAMMVGSAWATTSAYDDSLLPHLEQRIDDARALTAAAEYAQIRGDDATTLVAAADVSYTGAAGYMLEGNAIPAGAEAAGLWMARSYGSGHIVLFVSLLLLATVMLILQPFLVKLVVACRDNPWAYTYVVPSMAGMVLLVFIPFLTGIGLSFFDNDARRYYFIGMANFVEILAPGEGADVSFYWTLFSTILWTVTNVILHVSIGLGLALILKEPMLRFKRVYRVLLIIPWAIPNYITALIWKGMFNKEFGAVNQVIELVQGAIGMTPSGVDWLGGGFATAFTANLVTNTWLGFPFMMVVALGALQSIPGALYEAAEIDGATPFQKFRHITLPLLKPALFPAIILGSIWTFNMFNVIYLVSGGGPNNSTEILITDAYRAFAVLGRYGLAAAYSVLIFVILLLYTLITNRITNATEGAFD